jgi:hypothetical protein
MTACRSAIMVPDPKLEVAEIALADEVVQTLEDFRPERWGLPAYDA